MSVLMLRSARAQTLPPRPPSPPSGPPRGTYFSRRKCAEPSPPLPACTSIFASSMNFMVYKQKSPIGLDRASWSRDRLSRRSCFYDADRVVVVFAAHAILDLPGDTRIERVVAADADVLARVHPRAALADEDLAGVDPLAAEDLDA